MDRCLTRMIEGTVRKNTYRTKVRYTSKIKLKYGTLVRYGIGLVYTVRTKFQKFLRSYVEGVFTIQNGAYERNSLTAYSVGGHNIIC